MNGSLRYGVALLVLLILVSPFLSVPGDGRLAGERPVGTGPESAPEREAPASPRSVTHVDTGRHEGALRWEMKDFVGASVQNLTVEKGGARLVSDNGSWNLLTPGRRTSHTIVWDELRGQMLLYGGSGDFGVLNDTWAYSPPNETWTRLADGPSRYAHVAVWDTVRGQMLVYGGTNGSVVVGDVWAYDPAADSWKLLNSAGPACKNHAAVWDPGNLVLRSFGGEVVHGNENNQLWAYDPSANSWKQGPSGPSARDELCAAWDTQNNQMLIFGGWYNKADTWAYSPSMDKWTQKATRTTYLFNHKAVWDTQNNRMLVFGGQKQNAGVMDELWSYSPSSDRWTMVNGWNPDDRVRHALCWDAAGSRMFLFGGDGHAVLDDIWAYHPATGWWEAKWGPPPLSGHNAVWDDRRGQVLVFGGETDQTWAYNLSTGAWSPRARGPNRVESAAVWDPLHGLMLVYGGESNETWVYNPENDSWAMRAYGPPKKTGHTAVWDDWNGRMLVFGGSPTRSWWGVANDLWSYDPEGDAWQKLSPAGPPPLNRTEHSAAWDSGSGRMIVFGGLFYDGNTQYLKDTWAYSPSSNSWSQMAPGPFQTNSHSAIWDRIHGEMLVYGGNTQGTSPTNMWSFSPGNNSWSRKDAAFTTLANHAALWNDRDNEMVVMGGYVNWGNLRQIWTYGQHFAPGGAVLYQPIVTSDDWIANTGLAMNASVPPGTGLSVRLRASPDGIAFGDWQPFGEGSLPLLQGRYIQWMADLSSGGVEASPCLFNLTAHYIVNTAPRAYVDNIPSQHHNTFFRLSGWGSDAEGDPLSFRWAQTAGPPARLENSSTPNASFYASEPGRYTFSLTVNDSFNDSQPAAVSVSAINWEPSVAAGPDIVAHRFETVVLAGTGTDAENDSMTFTWNQSGGPAVELANAGSANASFVPVALGMYTFTLVANDSYAESRPDLVNVTVVNLVPTAFAGNDSLVPRLEKVMLEGSAVDVEGDPLTCSWTQTSGPPVPIEDNASFRASFVPRKPGAYVFSLVASDPYDAGAPASVKITAFNRLPVLAMPADLLATANETVVLNASAADQDGDALAYRWSQRGGPSVQLVNATKGVASFLAVAPGNYTFRLAVNDSYGESSGTVNVTVRPANRVPRFTSQPPRTATVGQGWRYEVSSADDDDQDALTLSLVQAPHGMVLTGSRLTWTPRANQSGITEVRLALTDGRDTVYQNWTVSVKAAPAGGLASGGAILWGLVLSIVAAAAVAVVLMRRRSGRREAPPGGPGGEAIPPPPGAESPADGPADAGPRS